MQNLDSAILSVIGELRQTISEKNLQLAQFEQIVNSQQQTINDLNERLEPPLEDATGTPT